MNGTEEHHGEQEKPSSKGQILHVLVHLWNLVLNNVDDK
jgi:hypothetical protein